MIHQLCGASPIPLSAYTVAHDYHEQTYCSYLEEIYDSSKQLSNRLSLSKRYKGYKGYKGNKG